MLTHVCDAEIHGITRFKFVHVGRPYMVGPLALPTWNGYGLQETP